MIATPLVINSLSSISGHNLPPVHRPLPSPDAPGLVRPAVVSHRVRPDDPRHVRSIHVPVVFDDPKLKNKPGGKKLHSLSCVKRKFDLKAMPLPPALGRYEKTTNAVSRAHTRRRSLFVPPLGRPLAPPPRLGGPTPMARRVKAPVVAKQFLAKHHWRPYLVATSLTKPLSAWSISSEDKLFADAVSGLIVMASSHSRDT